MTRLIKILFLALLMPAGLYCQLTPVTNQYILNPITINPSLAGNRGTLNIAAFYRRQWVGIPGAPEIITLTADAPLPNTRIGLGFNISNDKYGVTKETRFGTSYAYKIQIGEGNLSMGLGAGIITTNTAWSDLTVDDPGDENYLINSRAFVVPDFSFGFYYSRQRYFAGLSVPKLISYKFDFNKNRFDFKVDPEKYLYMLNTGYLFNLTTKLLFLPSTLLSFSPYNGELLYDINAHFNLSDRLWLGASYRSDRSIAGLIQIAINYQIKVAYIYDFDTSTLRRYSSGSHEIMLRYEFHYKLKVVNQLVF